MYTAVRVCDCVDTYKQKKPSLLDTEATQLIGPHLQALDQSRKRRWSSSAKTANYQSSLMTDSLALRTANPARVYDL